MNRILMVLILIALISIIVIGQTANVMSIKYPGYVLTVPQNLEGYGDAEFAPFVSAKVDSLPKKAEQSRFGILFRDDAKNLSTVTLLEILDAATNKVIRKISLDEYYNPKENDLKFIKDISVAEDEALPGSKKIQLSFALQSTSALKVKVRLYGKVEGTISQSPNGFVITNNEPLTQLKPALLFQAIVGVPIKLDIKKEKQQSFILTSNSVSLEPNQKTKVLSFDIVGSTISFAKYIPQQIENVKNYYAGRKTTPSVAIVTVSEKPSTTPKDTMTYVIYYHNIGTAPATDVNINGQIPGGTSYLEGSAEAEFKEVSISFERKEVKPPAIGEVISLKWNDKQEIKSGEERWVRYKVVVR